MKDILSREETCKEIYLLISNVIADLSRKFEADQISHQTFRESADKYFRLSVSASMHLQYGDDTAPYAQLCKDMKGLMNEHQRDSEADGYT